MLAKSTHSLSHRLPLGARMQSQPQVPFVVAPEQAGRGRSVMAGTSPANGTDASPPLIEPLANPLPMAMRMAPPISLVHVALLAWLAVPSSPSRSFPTPVGSFDLGVRGTTLLPVPMAQPTRV